MPLRVHHDLSVNSADPLGSPVGDASDVPTGCRPMEYGERIRRSASKRVCLFVLNVTTVLSFARILDATYFDPQLPQPPLLS